MDTINVLVSTFQGLSLPKSLVLRLSLTATTTDLFHALSTRLPPTIVSEDTPLNLTTTSNRLLHPSSAVPLSSLLHSSQTPPTPSQCPLLLPINLTAPLPGGKGGFGSQLRAAGGKMSSRKRKAQADAAAGSARNLDGRRLRTVAEAKGLAAYLSVRPEMERREKEERRKRWVAVVEMAERREGEMSKGIGGDGRRRGLEEGWEEGKEEGVEGVRNAVRTALAGAMAGAVVTGDGEGVGGRKEERKGVESGGSSERSKEESGEDGSEDGYLEHDDDVMELDDVDMARLKAEAEAGDVDAIWVLENQLKLDPPPVKKRERMFEGFDDDDEFASSEDESEAVNAGKGKNKAKALA